MHEGRKEERKGEWTEENKEEIRATIGAAPSYHWKYKINSGGKNREGKNREKGKTKYKNITWKQKIVMHN